ncbi:MAG: hypothetical protein QOE34_1495, partial [Verrucomicrobiota bacterium]
MASPERKDQEHDWALSVQRYLRRAVWAPRILSMSGIDGLTIPRQHLAKLCYVQVVPLRPKRRQVFFREPEQSDRRGEPLPVFWMGRMLEMLLQMNERARGLDQALEKLRVFG